MGEVPGPLGSPHQAAAGQQADNRHHKAGCPEDGGASGQRENRDEEGVDQSKECASRQSSPPLPSLRVLIVGVDDRHGDDEQAEDGGRCARARGEEHLVVAQQPRHLTSIAGLRASTTSVGDGSRTGVRYARGGSSSAPMTVEARANDASLRSPAVAHAGDLCSVRSRWARGRHRTARRWQALAAPLELIPAYFGPEGSPDPWHTMCEGAPAAPR